MNAPAELIELVERFRRNEVEYKSPDYNETQLRRDFLDPFFALLGWDIDNKEGKQEAYRDVVHEFTLRTTEWTKAPDYLFRLGDVPKFYLEAKKPSVNVQDDSRPAFQVRRYGWSGKLLISVLSDFEELSIYDTRVKPKEMDRASTARLFHCKFEEYEEKWSEIYAVLSREAVASGSLEQLLEGESARGTEEVGKAFLKEIERWRELLAKQIAKHNSELTQAELNAVVQLTIDRIIFLRIAEDRGIETYGKLQSLINGQNIYSRLLEVFHRADQRYNSGLFHLAEERGREGVVDRISPVLDIDDEVLRDIIQNMYFPYSPYVFSEIPTDILGQVYEQFLGKVIRISKGHQAEIEEKPEVRKAGGVYYTPSYIVDYIVENTVGKLLEGKNPKKAEAIRILDPACGSGSFLLGAYDYLLRWHRDWYVSNKPEKWAKGKSPAVYLAGDNDWRLTTDKKKEILLNNIYGVDLDAQAVEVTKLSLLLKVLEGENEVTVNRQQRLRLEFSDRLLPDLDSNIKCGNSLIDPAYFLGQIESDIHTLQGVNPFDWEHEFKDIMKNGGFDCVIGNPPYLSVDDVWGKGDERLMALKSLYPNIYSDKTDILFYFLAKAVKLCKNRTSFIVSRAFLEAYKAEKLRSYLGSQVQISQIIDFRNFHIFPGIGITTCIITFQIDTHQDSAEVYKLRGNLSSGQLVEQLANPNLFEEVKVNQAEFDHKSWIFTNSAIKGLHSKIDAAGDLLGETLLIGQGMQTGRNDVFAGRSYEEIAGWHVSSNLAYKRASNSDIQRYCIRDRGEYILYPQAVSSFEELPEGVQRYLLKHTSELRARAAYKRGDCEWWQFTWPLHAEHYDKRRILCPYLATSNRFALDEKKEFLSLTDTTVLFDNEQAESLLYLLGLLNSKLLTFRFRSIGKLKGGGIYEYFWNSISKLPVRRINFSDPADVTLHDEMVQSVEHMIQLQGYLIDAVSEGRAALQRSIDATDKKIDHLTYELYGLTRKEIEVVETSLANQ